MKYFFLKITLCVVILVSIHTNLRAFQDSEKEKKVEDKNTTKPLPIYNLFQLSRYLNNTTLSFEERKELMNLTLFYVGKENVETLHTKGNIPNLSQLYRDIILPEGKVKSIKDTFFSNLCPLYIEESKNKKIKKEFVSKHDDKPPRENIDLKSNGKIFELKLKSNGELTTNKDYIPKFKIKDITLDSIINNHKEIKSLKLFIDSTKKTISSIKEYNPNAFNDLLTIVKAQILVEKNKREIKIKDSIHLLIKNDTSSLGQLQDSLKKEKDPNHHNNKKLALDSLENSFINLDYILSKIINRKRDEINKIIDNSTIKKKDLLRDDLNKINTITKTITDSLTKYKINGIEDSIKFEIEKVNANYTLKIIAEAKNSIEALKKDIYDLLHRPTLDYLSSNIHLNSDAINSLRLNTSEKVATTNTQATINLVQDLRQNTPSSSFGIPSESQLINSMAIFLAKRAKQESVIWFMDQVRNNMSSPLIQDAFPETFNLLLSLEDYKTPNFSSGWRNAIAKDFVQLPKNIVQSEWVENVIYNDIHGTNQNIKNLKQLRFAISMLSGIDSLVSNKYGYRDIIRHFYLKNKSLQHIKNTDELTNQSPTKIFNALYIITNELFSIDLQGDTKKLRLLSYEELNSLNAEEWEIFTTLLATKYKDDLESFNLNLDPTKKEIWALNIGNVLQTFSQFDKLNQEVKEQTKEISQQNFHNVWQSVATVIKQFSTISKDSTLIDKGTIKHPKIFDILSSAIGIYESIHQQDFARATKNLFSIININNPSTASTYTYKDFKIELPTPTDPKNNFEVKLSRINNKSNNLDTDQITISKNKDNVNFKLGANEPLTLSSPQLKQIQALLATKDKNINKNINEVISVIISNSDQLISKAYEYSAVFNKEVLNKLLEINSKNTETAAPELKVKNNLQSNVGKKLDFILSPHNIIILGDTLKHDEDLYKEIFLLGVRNKVDEYTKAIKKEFGLELEELFNLSRFADFKLQPELIKSELQRKMLAGEFESLIPAANETISKLGIGKINDKYINKVVQLVSFFGDVANARNQDDLANVIDSHVLPPTSYKLKAKMKRSIDLNAYVGAQAGYLIPTSNEVTFERGNIFGITAPIGLTFSCSTKQKRFFSTLGIHLGILDLGNLVNHYLFKPNELYNQKVHFSEVVSPSIAFVASIKNSPFALFASAKGLPLKATIIQSIQQNSLTNSSKIMNKHVIDAYVISAGLKVDIPLMNMFSKEHQN